MKQFVAEIVSMRRLRHKNLVQLLGYCRRKGELLLATLSSDVFGFGVFLLEVACGRRPIQIRGLPEEMIMIEWVIKCWRGSKLLDVVDPRLEGSYVVEEVKLILELGLLCTHCIPDFRPSMRQVIQYLDGNITLSDIQPDNSGIDILTRAYQTLDFPVSILSSHDNNIKCSPIISDMAIGLSAASSGEENFFPLVSSITVSIGGR
ncbi:hypothetical protein ACFE04_013432 [Oxalis oulophora]